MSKKKKVTIGVFVTLSVLVGGMLLKYENRVFLCKNTLYVICVGIDENDWIVEYPPQHPESIGIMKIRKLP